MGLSTPQGGFERKPRPTIPIGPQAAILYGIVDLGTHVEMTQWGEKRAPKVMFLWEFPYLPEHVFDEAKGPQRLSQVQEYNFYTDDKSNLVKALKSWRGVSQINMATDLPVYLGKGCQLMIEQKPSKKYPGEINSKIMNNGAIILPPTADYGPPKNPTVFFDMDKFTWPAFHSLNMWIQKKIKQSVDWNNIIQKYGAEPANPNSNAGQQGQNQPQQQQFVQHQQPVQQQYVQQQPVYRPQQTVGNPNPAPVSAPQFHSGHNPAMQQVSGPNTQQFNPQVNQMPQSTGIIVGDPNSAPAF